MRDLGNPSLSCQAVSLNDSTLSRTFLNLHGGSGELFTRRGKNRSRITLNRYDYGAALCCQHEGIKGLFML